MQTWALDWQQSAVLAVAVLPVSYAAGRFGPSWLRRAAPFGIEIAIIAALYALWQRAGEIALVSNDGALRRAHDIERWERDWHLPSEKVLQPPLIHHAFLGQVANIYYATMHFGVMFVFLVWLFVRHRDRYPQIRRSMALTTAVCLLVQLLPVAPPRMLTDLGFVDIALKYNQSVYNTAFDADSLSAMPSVHVAWAVLIGWYVARLSPSRWRWIGPAHVVVTVLVVVSTANHFWADGIVAVAILVACTWVNNALTAAARRWWRGVRGAHDRPPHTTTPATAAGTTPDQLSHEPETGILQ